MNFFGKGQTKGVFVPDFLLLEKRLTMGARYTYAELARLCDETATCWPSQKYLADRLGVSVRSVHNYLRQLERLKFIAIEPGKDGDTNTYTLLPHPLALAKGDEKIAEQGPEKAAAVIIKQEEKKTPLTPHRGDLVSKAQTREDFDRMWAAWPVKEARRRALRRWLRLWRAEILPPIEKLMDILQLNLAQNPRWQRGFIPYLVTWLRERRWEETFESVSKPLSPVNDCHSDKNEIQNPFYAKEENSKPQNRNHIPDSVWNRLQDILHIWNAPQILEHEKSRLRGLWMHLYLNKMLPSIETIQIAAQTSTCSFVRWLHDYNQAQLPN
jgi:DNA-binding MarR family transcriptional regulator